MAGYTKEESAQLKKFGAAIRKRREELGLSQEELAEKVGLHRTYIGGMEQGRRNVGVLNIIKILKSLEMNAGELIK